MTTLPVTTTEVPRFVDQEKKTSLVRSEFEVDAEPFPEG
jgi:hypothetical protein